MHMDSRSIEDAASGALRDRIFVQRRYSWIARDGDVFFKIPRIGNSVEEDCNSDHARSMAREEYDNLIMLSVDGGAVISPLLFVEKYACIVLPFVHGQDLRDLLLADPTWESRKAMLDQAMILLAKLHAKNLDQIILRPKHRNYADDDTFPYAFGEDKFRKTLVVRGYEVRNLRVAEPSKLLRFFDPHQIEIGFPEEDISRFALSLLMLRWGRGRVVGIWDRFSLAELVAKYEEASGVLVDWVLLKYSFRWNSEMRSKNAGAIVRRMRWWMRPSADAYRRLFFKNVQRWAEKNGV